MNRKLLPLLLVLLGVLGQASANHLSSSLMFTARMSGDAEVPAVATNGQGLAIFTFDENKSTMYVNVSLSSLSGPLTGMHIHEGDEGENGPVVIDLTSILQGNRAKGAIPVSRDDFAKLINGEYYINAHTEMHPGGEIRGQIRLETDTRFSARLSGANEVPAVATDGNGLFIANLSHSGNLVSFNMVFQGLSSDVTGAHIHNAPAGTNGGVIFDLGPFIFGNVILGTWDPTGYLDELRAGNLYVNVHTVNNPGGEIRGQLVLEEGLLFDAILDGDQEFPSVETDGRGVALVTVTPDLDSVSYYILFDSLSGPATSAHFHSGIAGVSGGPVIDISDDINGNTISGSMPISMDLLNAMLEGGLYINIHTDSNPGGEIRGQVYKLARESYLFDMNGGQEVPSTTTTATGAGIVTIDRDQTNAHYMIVYSGLMGEFTASHFHNAPPGVNGGVIFNLTDSFNDFGGAYGYWDQNSTPAFETSHSLMFREGDMYVNVHSDLFPGGEIRGNILRTSNLFSDLPFDPGFGNDFILAAEMRGSEENPPVATDAIGIASIYFGEDRTTAQVNVTVTGLSGPITGAHIHEGVTGVNGPVVFPLSAEGNRIHAELTGITPEQLANFISGAYYINVHTAENPGGEIRGQIFIEQDVSFVADMNGDQENPPVATDARGLGVFHYTIGTLALDVNIQLTELSSPITGVHLHEGAPGENGPVLIDLGLLRDGNVIQGTVDLTIPQLIALSVGAVYVNVHTENNPGGEIRGQLDFQNGLSFDGWMSGLQEIPFTTSSGSGLAVATVSPDLTNIDVWVVTDALSGDAGAAHFHNASIGQNGGVVLDLTTGLSDNDITFSGPVSESVVSELLSGNIYTNIHTPAYPGGELRGQMFRLARDGYGFDLCTEQEVGTIIAPTATGSSVVTIDRLHSNLNVAVVTDGLTGPVTGAHIHEAPIGVNGPVIVPLTLVNGGVFGYGVPMDSAVIAAVLSGNTYVNIHTSLHPGGEIRGQVVKELLCSLGVSVNELGDIVEGVALSPVPVTDHLQVSIETLSNTSLTMSIFDLSGKIISTDRYELSQGENNVTVETGSLSPGFYMLMISNGKAAHAYKFVK